MRKKTVPLTIAFTGGGTGGHIYPGLAVADCLLRRASQESAGDRPKIIWIGSAAAMDKAMVEQSGLAAAFYGIPSGKFRRYVSVKTFFDLFKVAAGFFASFFLLLKTKPAALFSKGGYVSVPPCFAAKLLSIPVYTHECDFTPGLATRLTARTAARIFVSYRETTGFFPKSCQTKITVTGNPIRPAFYTASSEKGLEFLKLPSPSSLPLLLVMGGSLGAKQINDLAAENLPWLCERFQVVHQTGNQEFAALPEETLPPELRRNYHRYQFFHAEFPDVMAAADIALSRAGASAVWECAACGKPMALIPLGKQGSRGDQIDNAAYFAKRGAALVLDPATADSKALKSALEQLLDKTVRETMAQAARAAAGGVRSAQILAEILYTEMRKELRP
jgi:UDP-N-acetylglucosamine--N-acetylmuramyl-(pentapeptide) pyrophosphoryl-undecaprenol N-acetylglucosamine transferase